MSEAEKIVAACRAIRKIALDDGLGLEWDSFSMACAAYEAINGRDIHPDVFREAVDLALSVRRSEEQR